METMTLGISPCPNDVYIFAGLILGKVAWDGPPFCLAYEDVETLNTHARQNAYDLVKISYANYRFVQSGYELLEAGGALGRGVGPLLLTNSTKSLDPTREVLVPGEYTTANFLLDFFLQETTVTKRFLPFDTLYDELCNRPGAQGVVIHEKRFTYQQDGLTLIQDLGEYWEGKTGHPIPLGAIVARRSLNLTEKFDDLTRRSLAWADAHPEDAFALCRTHAQDLSDGVIQAHIDLYVNRYSRDLGADGREAVKYFFTRQQEHSKQTVAGRK